MTSISRIGEPLFSGPAADADLRQRVALYLLHTGHAPVRHLNVSAKDGVISLGGTVPTYYTRQLGIACAQRVAGVRAVIDQIDVARPIDSCSKELPRLSQLNSREICHDDSSNLYCGR